jgi:hypothetical protein
LKIAIAADKSIKNLSERLDNLDNLYPNSLQISHWKGKLIVSVEEWEQISGLGEIYAREKEIESRTEVRESLKIKMKYPEDAWQELVSIREKKEFRPEALGYFPDGFVSAAVSPCWSCPQAPDLFSVWVSDYKELLMLELKIDPEQEARERYQYFKYENWFFHKSSWYMRGVNGYDGKGCNNAVCVPECKFYPSEGKLYDGEGFDGEGFD